MNRVVTTPPYVAVTSEVRLWPGCAFLTVYRFNGLCWIEQRPVSLN